MATKNESFQIHRNSLIWLLTAVSLAVFPHFLHIPFWLTAIVVICIVCRTLIYRSRMGYPKPFIKVLMVMTGVAAIFVHYKTVFGPEAGVSLLILTYSLKLLEMHREKDAYVIVILTYFVVATQFLYSTSLLSSLFMMAVILITTSSLIGLNQYKTDHHPKVTLKLSALMMLQSLPLMLLLFIFFPRIPPFWSLNMDSSRSVTGLSESMSPSDVAELGRSDELVFRAEFEGDIPTQESLYWRSLIFEKFDGRSWSASGGKKSGHSGINTDPKYVYWPTRIEPQWLPDPDHLADPVHYNVILEPSGKHYLPALEIPAAKEVGIGLTRNMTLVNREPINKVTRYEATSYLSYRFDEDLYYETYHNSTRLTDDQNPRARQFAEERFAQVNRDPYQYIQSILNDFRHKEFIYTLQPPTSQEHIIDHFLFDTKQGFCIHYAGAFVYLMRAVGIPARVVAGFQGGEVNPIGQYVLVHQFDAHGWSEIWIEGRGWVRYDPTAYVAPERILEGVQETYERSSEGAGDNVFSAISIRGVPLLNQIRLSLDYVNFAWDRFVVGYNNKSQQQFMEKYFNGIGPGHMIAVLIIMIKMVLLIMAYVMFRLRPTEKSDELDRAYLAFCKRLAKLAKQEKGLKDKGLGEKGLGENSVHRVLKVKRPDQLLDRQVGETPNHYLTRVRQLRPDLAEPLQQATDLYCTAKFATAEGPSAAGLSGQGEGARRLVMFKAKNKKSVARRIDEIRIV